MKFLRSAGRNRKGRSAQIIRFPAPAPRNSIITPNYSHWSGQPIGNVPAAVQAAVFASRRIAAEQAQAAAFSETVARCLRTIAEAREARS